jgi:2-amino-4-hydroxy-6-hydroxymethyldihydropteridine diphosphokinase
VSGIYLALGSNLGNRQANLAMALRMLEPLVRVEAVSPLYESAPQPPAPPPDYLNCACRVVTGLTPAALLRCVKQIERLIGRREDERWAPRPIDVDIVLYGDEVVEAVALSIPHARLAERAFVLRPLLDLDAELVDPRTGERLEALLRRLGAYELREVGDRGGSPTFRENW